MALVVGGPRDLGAVRSNGGPPQLVLAVEAAVLAVINSDCEFRREFSVEKRTLEFEFQIDGVVPSTAEGAQAEPSKISSP